MTASEPVWLLKSVVLALHEEQLAEHGGPVGVRDETLLESALAKPQNRWAYEQGDMATLAAAYAFGIARNHPFTDGNKRAAWVVAETFLVLNGLDLHASDAESLPVMLDVASGAMDEGAFAIWVRERNAPV